MLLTKFPSLFATLLALLPTICFAADPPVATQCGDWEPFKDESCYKVVDKENLHALLDAEKLCEQNGATLVSIHSKDEQDFLVSFLFNRSQVVDNVWLDSAFVPAEKKFLWNHNAKELTFTNWAEGSPKNLADSCVQMSSGSGSVGKWTDEPCKRKNLAVCQKAQPWSNAQLQKVLLEVVQNPVPLGFVYVQLPGERSPVEIWPRLTWSDVSSVYAGVFFRVVGGQSDSFGGGVQEDSAPRLTQVEYKANVGSGNTISVIPRGEVSPWLAEGYHFENVIAGTRVYNYVRYTVSGGEVRPRNVAIKVWKRSG